MLMGCFSVVLLLLQPAYAQAGWSDPYSLYQSDYSVTHPIAVSDVNGIIHVFWTESDANDAIIPTVFHTDLKALHWSTPVSILVSPGGGSIIGFTAVADREGGIHAIWQTADHSLYYASVEAAKAGDPNSWTAPLMLGTSFAFPGITADMSTGIYVAYPSDSTDAVNILASKDNGHTWDAPLLVARSSAPHAGIDYSNVIVGPEGNLYVAWSEFRLPDGWPPIGVFFASSTDNGLSWSSPVQLAGEGYDLINLAVNQNGEVFALWNGMISVGGRFISISDDRGQTWGEPIAVVAAGLGGTSGYPHLVFDSLNTGHMITALDWQGGIQYLKQDQDSWTTGLEISSSIDYASYAIPSLEFPWLCITQGNMLHVVYEAGMQEIFYQQMLLDTPSIQSPPIIPNPTPGFESITVITPSPVMDVVSYPEFDDEGMVMSSISQPINLAALCVLGLIVSVYLVKRWRYSR